MSEHAVPRLLVPLVRNEAEGRWELRAPVRTFSADLIAVEILELCTGDHTIGWIVDDLAKTYKAPREKILMDVRIFLRDLIDKKLLELRFLH